MDIQLKVTPEQLVSQAGKVEGEIKNLESDLREIQNIVSRTSGYWIGLSGDSARKAFSSFKDDSDLLIKRLKEHPTDLLNMAGVYELYESLNVETANELNPDVIV